MIKLLFGDDLPSGARIFHLGGDSYMYLASANTIAGVATFFLTYENTAIGTAIFTEIQNPVANAFLNTGSAVAAPQVAGKLLSLDNKVLTYNVIRGRTLTILGATQEFVPDGTKVYLQLIGRIVR